MDQDRKTWQELVDAVVSAHSVQELSSALQELLCLTTLSENPISLPADICQFALTTALDKLDSTWMDHISIREKLQELVKRGDPQDSLSTILSKVKGHGLRPSYRDEFLVNLLQFYVKIVLEQTFMDSVKSYGVSANTEFVQLIISLPDRLGSFLYNIGSNTQLIPSKFYPSLASYISKSLLKIYERLKMGLDCQLEFCGMIVGKLAMVGQGDCLACCVLHPLAQKGREDFVWRRIARTLFKHLPSRSYEPVLACLISVLENGRQLEFFIGNDLTTDAHLEFLLTKKFFFNRIFPTPQDVEIYRNILAFFCAIDDRGRKFLDIYLTLLEAWSRGYGQKYMAVEYELSLTKAILIGAGILRTCFVMDRSDANYRQQALKAALHGVEKRLSSTNPSIRRNGMLVGEVLSTSLQDIPGVTLKFEIGEDEETRQLQDLLLCKLSCTNEEGRKMKVPEWEKPTPLSGFGKEQPLIPVVEPLDADSFALATDELVDSDDDDLVPCAREDSGPLKNKKFLAQPKYIQDCYDGLIKKDDIPHRRTCLKSLAGLLNGQADVAEHIATDLAKVLLGMQLEGSLDDCRIDRFDALVVLTINHPKQIAAFLGHEVLSRNYGLGTRLEILHVIRSAVARLTSAAPGVGLSVSETALKDGTSAVKERESKSRRFATATKLPHTTKHRFTNLAKLYLLPLMGRGETTNVPVGRDILHMEDAVILSHLIHTMSLIILASRELPDTEKLALQVMEFAWNFRSHTDPAVKQAVLYSMNVVLQSVSPEGLLSNVRLVEQVRLYLPTVFIDVNSQSALLARQIETMLDFSMAKALFPSPQERNIGPVDLNAASDGHRSVTLKDVCDLSKSMQKLSYR